jgi:hypothetical protein
MITIQNIIDEINGLILSKFPASTFYIQNIPEGFERPSFFIELISSGSEDNNISITEEEMSIQIVYFAPVDDYYIADSKNQYLVSDTVKNIFRKGYINVGDRAVKITKTTGGPRDNEVYISINLQYFEDRPMDTEVYELIGKVNIK